MLRLLATNWSTVSPGIQYRGLLEYVVPLHLIVQLLNFAGLVDMTMQASTETPSPASPSTDPIQVEGNHDGNLNDEELALNNRASHNDQSSNDDATELRTRAGSVVSSSSQYIRRKTSQLLGAIAPSSHRGDTPISPKLAELVNAFRDSEQAIALKSEIEEASRSASGEADVNGTLPDVALENSLTRGRKRASWGTQFRILSGRAFKNLYRDPALLTAHYVSSVIVARKFPFSLLDGWLT